MDRCSDCGGPPYSWGVHGLATDPWLEGLDLGPPVQLCANCWKRFDAAHPADGPWPGYGRLWTRELRRAAAVYWRDAVRRWLERDAQG
jgi:hypothetical protein